MCSFLFIIINGVLTFGIGTHLSETCDASVVVCVSVVSVPFVILCLSIPSFVVQQLNVINVCPQFVLSKVLLYLYYLERLYIFSYARRDGNAGTSPSFLARFKCTPWVGGAFIFVFGVPCASE